MDSLTERGASPRIFRILAALCLLLSACSVLEKEEDPQTELAKKAIEKPLPPEKTKELMSKVGSNWLYGQGVGETALTVGTIFAFPPYAIYVLGNGALSLSGYKPLHVTDALPDDARDGWNSVYDGVTGAPGHVTAAVAEREYREPEVVKQDLEQFMSAAYDTKGTVKKAEERPAVEAVSSEASPAEAAGARIPE